MEAAATRRGGHSLTVGLVKCTPDNMMVREVSWWLPRPLYSLAGRLRPPTKTWARQCSTTTRQQVRRRRRRLAAAAQSVGFCQHQDVSLRTLCRPSPCERQRRAVIWLMTTRHLTQQPVTWPLPDQRRLIPASSNALFSYSIRRQRLAAGACASSPGHILYYYYT